MALEISLGNAVSGESRFDRPKLQKRFMRFFDRSAGIKMFGLRRIGKSTMRLYLMEQLPERKTPFIYIDAQGLNSLTGFLQKMQSEMPGDDSFMSRMTKMLTSPQAKALFDLTATDAGKIDAASRAYWDVVSGTVLNALQKEDNKPVLIIDEFSYLIKNLIEADGRQGRDDAEKLLASLREWRGEGMRMLLTGSIGMAGLAREYGLSQEHLNDMMPFSIPELTEEEAENFIDQATEDCDKWCDEHTKVLLQEVGVYYPIFLVTGLLEIDRDDPAEVNEIPGIFAEVIRPTLHSDFYNQFGRRFKEYAKLGKKAADQKKLMLPALKQILEAGSEIAHCEINCTKPYEQNDLALALEMMAEDGFIAFSENSEGERCWKSANRLASLWWKRANLT